VTTRIDMGDEYATKIARSVFLRTSTLGRKKTRALWAFLSERTGLHTTADIAMHFGVECATVLRRLRRLKEYGLVTQVKGCGRTEKLGVGGRDPDLWGAVQGESIDSLAERVVSKITMGQLTREEAAR